MSVDEGKAQRRGAPGATSKSQGSRQATIRQFLALSCEAFGKELTAPLVRVWEVATEVIPEDILPVALIRCIRECTRFPVPADAIARSKPTERETKALNDESAEQAWQRALAWSMQKGNLPHGASPTGALSERERHALRVCGGANRVESCSQDQLVWVRKLFIEAFQRHALVESIDYRVLPQKDREALEAICRSKGLPE